MRLGLLFSFCVLAIYLNAQSPDEKLLPYKTKLVIIDFWATWCTACIKEFPKLEKFQNQYADKLKIVLVNSKSTGDDLKKINAFKQKWEVKYGKLSLAMISEDDELERKFPHKSLPHYVWIVDGNIFAITSADQVSEENITAVINDKPVALSQKIEVDPERPLYLSDLVPDELVPGYSILIKGKNDALPKGYKWRKNNEDFITGIRITNVNLYDAYRYILTDYKNHLRNRRRIILDLSDSARNIFQGKDSLVSFDYISPGNGRLDHQKVMNTLNAFSGFNVQIRTMKTNCWVLRRAGEKDLIKTKGGIAVNQLRGDSPVLINNRIEHLVARLNEIPAIDLPVVDETGYVGNIDIRLHKGDFEDMGRLNTALLKYGLKLKEVMRELEMLVVDNKF